MKELSQKDREYLLNSIRQIKDFPKPGILFRDITTLIGDKAAFSFLLNHLKERYEGLNLDFIVGVESRGFIFGAALCAKLNLPFVPIRKPHKLPFTTVSQKYSLEYGFDELEIHIDAFEKVKNPRVLLIDDLIATGGTAVAAADLITQMGANLVEICMLLDLKKLGGSQLLARKFNVYSVLEA